MAKDRLRRTYGNECFSALGIESVKLFGYQKYLGAQPRLPGHAHSGCIEICYLTRGRQCFRVAGRNFWMTGGQAFITYPGEVHSTGDEPMGKCELYWIILEVQSSKGFLGLAKPVGERVVQDLSRVIERCFAVETYTGVILADIESKLRARTVDALALHNRLSYLLELTIEGGRRYTKRDLPRFSPVIEYIDRNLDSPLRVADLALVAGLSESRFKVAFKRAFGVSPAEYVTRERIEQAKSRLAHSDQRVTDIASDLGFSTPQYFSYVFRRYTGTSPRDYRTNF